jgi:hypothetical protein
MSDSLKEKLKKAEKEISKLKKKLKKEQTTYVVDNFEKFEELKTFLRSFKDGEKERYFYERKSRLTGKNEMIFKINSLIHDLIEYKCRKTSGDNYENRVSMDISALIKFLNTGRRSRKTKEEIEASRRLH